uniref:uncharacterized protein LOC120340563 n=1 Tax=Styela clava TaxID=7725 RepID=UPI00193955A2|nr:uncharacterized protein LOC120340563 [Styela clava]
MKQGWTKVLATYQCAEEIHLNNDRKFQESLKEKRNTSKPKMLRIADPRDLADNRRRRKEIATRTSIKVSDPRDNKAFHNSSRTSSKLPKTTSPKFESTATGCSLPPPDTKRSFNVQSRKRAITFSEYVVVHRY